MAKVVSKAFQLRKHKELAEGRTITVAEVAGCAGVERNALTRLEEGITVRFDGDFIARLCRYYGVGIGDILEYVPDSVDTTQPNATTTPILAAA